MLPLPLAGDSCSILPSFDVAHINTMSGDAPKTAKPSFSSLMKASFEGSGGQLLSAIASASPLNSYVRNPYLSVLAEENLT